jgi:hypothetical protein
MLTNGLPSFLGYLRYRGSGFESCQFPGDWLPAVPALLCRLGWLAEKTPIRVPAPWRAEIISHSITNERALHL